MSIECRTATTEAAARPPATPSAPDGYVEASLNYLADASVRPVTYNPPPGSGEPRRVGNYGSFKVRIHDGRPVARDLSLDRQGFVLVRHDSRVKDFYGERQVREVYYPEIERLVQQATGAAKIAIFDHTIRVADGAVERGLRAPVQLVHNDYTEKSAPQRVRDLLDAEEAARRLKRRYVEINVWRPIRGPVQMAPLALADARTIAPEDLVAADLVYTSRTGEIYHGAYNAAHRWYYFPAMQAHEAVLIKCFDSAKDGRARFSLHTSFEDSSSPADAPPRESIEVRCFAFFDA